MTAAFYFGKLPSRGDFVKSSQGAAVIQQLDTWVGRSLELLLAEPEGKQHYDDAAPVNFLFGSTRGRHFIAGRLVASHDLSRRRYPLILGAMAESDAPLQLLAHAPLVFAETWGRFAAAQQRALASDAGSEPLQEIEALHSELIPSLTAQQSIKDFAEQHTIDNVESMFRTAGHRLDLRRSLLALGVLLRPVLSQLKPSISKSLVLPLPVEKPLAALVAATWLDLAMPFFARAELEVALLYNEAPTRPVLSVGFCGAQPLALASAWQPEVKSPSGIDLRDAEWVDELLGQDVSLDKLAALLQHPATSLARAIRTFRETFTGA